MSQNIIYILIYIFIYGTKYPWDELAVGRTCNGTEHPGTKRPGTNLHWDETTINRIILVIHTVVVGWIPLVHGLFKDAPIFICLLVYCCFSIAINFYKDHVIRYLRVSEFVDL